MGAKGCYAIVIISILIAGTTTINYAFAEIDISLTPDDVVFNNHSFIVDINDTDAIEAGASSITVKIRAASGDSEEINVNFDPSWGKYRLVISTQTGVPNTGDNIIQAVLDDVITIEYGPTPWPFITYNTIHAAEPTADRWTFSTKIGCPQEDPADIDMDGICDAWENNPNGLVIEDLDGVSPFVPGTYTFDCALPDGERCGSDKPDIFLEIDWIESHKPDPKAIQQVIDAFKNARDSNNDLDGIRLHIQVDSLPAAGHIPMMYFPGYDIDGYRGYDQLKADAFGSDDEKNDPTTDWNEIRKLKHQAFHYGLFAHVSQDDVFQTGIGEVVGNDFLITLSRYTGKIGSTDQQAGTLMHELGHNLGLNHGGGEFDKVNNKPNLFSVMSYARQFADLDSNRKLDYSNATLGHHHTSPPQDSSVTVWGLHEETIQGYMKGLWEYPGHEMEPIIFSCPDAQVAPVIYLTGAQGGVDWDCDDDPTTRGRFPLNINNLPTEPNSDLERLDGHNDWDALNFAFSDNAGNYADGRHSKVASGISPSGGNGIPFGETAQTLAAKGLQPDTDFNYVTTNQEELTFEMVTLNRISNLLSLYRQIDMFDESEFSSGFSSGPNFSLTSTNSMILQNQLQSKKKKKKGSFNVAVAIVSGLTVPTAFADHSSASVSIPAGSSVLGCEENNECYLPVTVSIDVGGKVTWSNDDTAAHTVTSGTAADGPDGNFDSSLFMSGTTFEHTFDEAGTYEYFCLVHPWMIGTVVVDGTGVSEPKKDSFKDAVVTAINFINIHDIQNTQKTVQSIDVALQNSLSNTNYNKIQPITNNILGTYEKALGFGNISTDEIVNEPIVDPGKINDMIKNVEAFVDEIEQRTEIPCGDPFEISVDQCVCPSGTVEYEGDCIEGGGPTCQDPFVESLTGTCECKLGTIRSGNTCIPVDSGIEPTPWWLFDLIALIIFIIITIAAWLSTRRQ